MFWENDIPLWKPVDKHNSNFVKKFYFLPQLQKKLFFLGGGVQNKGNERSAKILDFDPLH